MTIPANVLSALAVEYSLDNENWATFGRVSGLGSIIRTRRFSEAPGETVTARYWRVVKVADPLATDWGAAVIRFDTVAMWVEAAVLDPTVAGYVEDIPFNYDDALQRYQLIMTEGNIDVWNQGAFQCSIVSPYVGAQVPQVTGTQMLDTQLLFHQDVAPLRVMRQGTHYEWDSRPLAFDSLPIYDYTGLEAGGVNAVQELFFVDYAAGDTFNITLEGQTTGPIAWDASMTTTAAAIQTAMIALPNVGAGGVSAAPGSDADSVLVTFEGALANSDVATMAPVTLHSTAGGVSVANITTGKAGGEPIISATRGWPATGVFYQQRLYLAGLKGRPETFLGSQIGGYFSFDTTAATDAGALNENIDTDAVTAVHSIFAGRHLQIFTNTAEFYFPLEPITPPTPVKQSTRRGSLASVSPRMMDRATIFLGPNGDALYDFEFEYFHDNYEATNLSVLASHIVSGCIDLGFRKHLSTTDADMAIMPKSDGTAAVMTALRDQEITGFVPWTTQGSYIASAGDLGGDLYVVTSRTTGAGVLRRYLERIEWGRMLDCSLLFEAGDPAIVGQTCAVGPALEGLTATLFMDGKDAGDVLVTDGVVALPSVPQTSLEVGLNFTVTGVTLPFVFQNDPRAGASMRPTVGEIAFRLGPTANLLAGIVGGKMWTVPLKAPAGQALGVAGFSGWTRLQMVPGFRPDAQMTFQQLRPGPLQIQEIVATATS